MKKIKYSEPNCISELTDTKYKNHVMYSQETVDRLIAENIKIKEKYDAKENYEVALQEIYQLCQNTFYVDDKDAIVNIMHIIEGVL